MKVQRCVARAVLLVAFAFGALATSIAAPVPKAKPREGTIVVLSGYGGAPRLYRADGTFIGELPFKWVWDCALSPDGTRAAVIERTKDFNKRPLWVVRVGAGADELGEPLAIVENYASVAWGGNEKVYLSEFRDPPGRRSGYMRPDRVTVCDLERGSATEDKTLHGYSICGLSPDGKHLLAQKFVTEPVEGRETVLLDATTGKLNTNLGQLWCPRFYGPDGVLGSRTKKSDPKVEEYFVYDLAGKRALPLKLPKEVTAGTASVLRVLPSPDGTRLLYVWSEEVPLTVDWPVGLPGPLRAARMTTCDRDGGNARTIFRPEIKTREDETRYHFGGTIDWR